jgi:hypothetical protein
MKPAIRPTTPDDGPQIARFLSEIFSKSPDDPALDQKLLAWKYWAGSLHWPGSRSFVLARGETILAHAGVVPGTMAWRGGQARAAHIIDWAARPGAIGAGTALMKHVAKMTDALIGIGGSDQTQAVLPTLGFRPAGTAVGFVRTLHPLRRIGAARRWSWRSGPHLARNLLWALTAPGARAAGCSIDRLEADACGRVTLPESPLRGAALLMKRSPEQLYHLLQCPGLALQLYEVRHPGRGSRGYFVLAHAPRQIRLVDCWIDSGEPTDWRLLFEAVVLTGLNEASAAELVTWSSDPAECEVLRRCGFHQRSSQPVRILPSQGTEIPDGTLRVEMVDNDAAYLGGGSADFWA